MKKRLKFILVTIILSMLYSFQMACEDNYVLSSIRWFTIHDYEHGIDAVLFLGPEGKFHFQCVKGIMYDFVLKNTYSVLIATNEEVIEITYCVKWDDLETTTLIKFEENKFIDCRIIGEINGGIWLMATPLKSPSDINRYLLYVKDGKILITESLASLLGLNDLVEKLKKEIYFIYSDSLMNTFYFEVAPFNLFSKIDTKVRYFLLNPQSNKWELMYQTEEKDLSPLVVYKDSIHILSAKFSFPIPAYIKLADNRSLRKRFIEEEEGSYIFLETIITINKGQRPYVTKVNLNDNRLERLQVKVGYYPFLIKNNEKYELWDSTVLVPVQILF